LKGRGEGGGGQFGGEMVFGAGKGTPWGGEAGNLEKTEQLRVPYLKTVFVATKQNKRGQKETDKTQCRTEGNGSWNKKKKKARNLPRKMVLGSTTGETKGKKTTSKRPEKRGGGEKGGGVKRPPENFRQKRKGGGSNKKNFVRVGGSWRGKKTRCITTKKKKASTHLSR